MCEIYLKYQINIIRYSSIINMHITYDFVFFTNNLLTYI